MKEKGNDVAVCILDIYKINLAEGKDGDQR